MQIGVRAHLNGIAWSSEFRTVVQRLVFNIFWMVSQHWEQPSSLATWTSTLMEASPMSRPSVHHVLGIIGDLAQHRYSKGKDKFRLSRIGLQGSGSRAAGTMWWLEARDAAMEDPSNITTGQLSNIQISNITVGNYPILIFLLVNYPISKHPIFNITAC